MQSDLEQAAALHQQGRLAEAAALYRKVLAASPGHARAGYLLALLHYQQGDSAAALAGANAVLKANPDLADALMLRGAVVQQDDPAQALDDFRAVTARQPGHGEAWYNQGVVLAKLGRPAEAIAAFDRALAIRPGAAAWNNKGIAQLELEQLQDSLASFDRALALDRAFAGAQYNRATALLRLQRPREALAAFELYLKAAPQSFEAWNNRGAALQQLEELAAAADSYARAAAIRPDYAPAWKNSGLVLSVLGRHDEAAAAFARATALAPGDAQGWGGQGEVLRQLKRYDQALASYEKALALNADDADLWYQYAGTMQACRPLDAALAAAERALALAPDHIDTLALKGSLLNEQNRIAEGLECFLRHAVLTHGRMNGEISAHKKRHDEEQRAWLAGEGVHPADGQLYLMGGARLPSPAVNPANSAAISAAWAYTHPQIVVIDDLLTQEALEALRRFCWGSTIWRRSYPNGYLGAMPEYGFACPLVAQIADELRLTFPAIFADHGLVQTWGFKYDSSLRGINLHADQAVVNVNFWITPDEANLDPDHGGLVIWDRSAPLDWEFARYNADEAAARQFLRDAGARPVIVPYRANRAVIFDSDLFHETDRIAFREGYLNRRINVTMLYGRRTSDGG